MSTSTTSATTTTTAATTTDPGRGVLPPVGRRLAAGALVVGAALNTAESVGMRLALPAQPDDVEEQLRLVGENTGTYAALTTAGTLAIPFMTIGFLALTHLLRQRAPRTGSTARVLLLAGMWGFLGMHVTSLLQVPLSGSEDPAAAATAVESWQSHPLLGVLFLAPFLLGTTLGLLLLAGGLLRTGALPRWIPACLAAFLVLDFAVRDVVPVDPHWLYLLACTATAVLVVRRGDAAWANR